MDWATVDWGAAAAAAAAVVVAVGGAIAAIAAAKRRNGENGVLRQTSTDSAVQTLKAAWELIDQLQEEIIRLNGKNAALEGRVDGLQAKVEQLQGLRGA